VRRRRALQGLWQIHSPKSGPRQRIVNPRGCTIMAWGSNFFDQRPMTSARAPFGTHDAGTVFAPRASSNSCC